RPAARPFTRTFRSPSIPFDPGPFDPFPRPCFDGGGGWIRTNVGARPTDLQSAPFNHSGTPPKRPTETADYDGFCDSCQTWRGIELRCGTRGRESKFADEIACCSTGFV